MPWGLKRESEDPWEAPFRAAVKALGGGVESYSMEGSNVTFGGKPQTIGIYNFVQGNLNLAPQHREQALKQWLSAALPGSTPALKDQQYAAIESMLMPRLGPPFDPKALKGLKPASVPWAADGILNFLVVDSPQKVSYVMVDHLEGWQKRFEDLLPVALENLRKRSNPKMWSSFPKMPEIIGCSTGDTFDASRALILRDLILPWPRFGVLVGIPRRETLLVLRLNDPLVFAVVPAFIGVIATLAAQGPYPISNRLLWFDGNRWEELPWSKAPDGINLVPTDRFAQTVLMADARPT